MTNKKSANCLPYFSNAFDNATIVERKSLIRTFIRHLEMDPEKEEIRVSFYPDNIVHSIGYLDKK